MASWKILQVSNMATTDMLPRRLARQHQHQVIEQQKSLNNFIALL